MPPLKNRVGQKFGRLTVIERGETKEYPCGGRLTSWKCLCECGNTVEVLNSNLVTGHTRSCGCLEKEHPNAIKHGMKKDNERLYGVWASMRQRCNDKNLECYKNYGDRGITVCEEWADFGSFAKWALENGYDSNAPYGECTLDRIDNNGNYEPSNCRWTNMLVQRHNQRRLHDWEDII